MKTTRLRNGHRILCSDSEMEALRRLTEIGLPSFLAPPKGAGHPEEGMSSMAKAAVRSARFRQPGGPLAQVDEDRRAKRGVSLLEMAAAAGKQRQPDLNDALRNRLPDDTWRTWSVSFATALLHSGQIGHADLEQTAERLYRWVTADFMPASPVVT